jgi:hypothetical protein
MLWDELQEDVSVEEGLFNVILGSVDPIVLSFYEAERYWLDITVEGEHMPSRVNLTSVAFAYRAQTADTALYASAVPEDYSDDRYVNVNGPDSVRGTYSGYMFRVKNYGTDGIYVYTPTSATGDAFFIDSAGNYGVYITDTGDDAIMIDGGHQRGIDMINITDDGIYMDNIGDYGIYMEDVTGDGIRLNDIEGDGIYISDAADYGLYISTTDYGMYIGSTRAGYDGIWINSAADEGIHISSAGTNGVLVNSVGNDGLSVSHAGRYGLYVDDSDNDGIWVASADGDGITTYGTGGGGELYSLASGNFGLRCHSYNEVSTNAGLWVYGYGGISGTWSTKLSTSSGDEPGFMVSSTDVELIASGTGTMAGGRAEIAFEQIFQEAISPEIPVKVVLTAQGAPSGLLYVASKSNQGFSVERLEIPDLAMKSDDITFDWIAIGRQKGYEQRPQVSMGEEDAMAGQLIQEEDVNPEMSAEELQNQKDLERHERRRQEAQEKQARDEAQRLQEEREEQSTD